jgi:acetyl esterase/lipase
MRKFASSLFILAAALLLFACASTSSGATAPAGMPAGGLMPGGGPPQAIDTSWIATKYLDVAYATASPTEKLDLFLPNEGTGPFPLIIEIHGGGFIMGDKSSGITPMLEGLKRGYAVASIAYRLSGEAIFPAAVNDVKAAIKFLRANAGKYNLAADRFAAWGGSAGGNLAAMAATSANVASLVDPSLGNGDVSDAVQAAVDWFGPLYFSTMDEQFKALGTSGIMGLTNSSNSAESKYLGKVIGSPEAQPLVEKASPLTYISANSPPMFIEHGTADRNVPITQSKVLAERLAAAIGADKVAFVAIEGAGHGTSQFEDPANTAKVLDFLDRFLK